MTTTLPALPATWIERIFERLIGIYGNQFRSKFQAIENGIDVGMENAKAVWADELAGFHNNPEAIAYALKNLPGDFPPNALEFAAICRRAPRKELPALEIKYDSGKAKDFAEKLSEIVGSQTRGSDPVFWATHPKTEMAFEFIRGAAQENPTKFQPCIDHLIATGRVSADGKHLLQKSGGNGSWVKA
jgi:hypothetical protein